MKKKQKKTTYRKPKAKSLVKIVKGRSKRKCTYCNRWIFVDSPVRHKHALLLGESCEFYNKKMEGHPDGRPTKLTSDVLKKTREYIDNCKDEIEEFHKTRGITSNTYERVVKVNLPSKNSLSLVLKVKRETMNDWIKESSEFSDLISEIKVLQKEKLVEGGLSGDYNPTIAKLLLNSTHGVVERREVTGKDGQSLFGNITDELDDEEEG